MGISPSTSGSHGYQYILIVGAFSSFLFGWGTGSNDVANAFGASVGSGALTLNQAILIAAVFEFTGAMVLGRVSTKTIAGGIADIKVFKKQPFAYAYGMMWTMMVGGIWQGWASKIGINVSATHSVIAGIVGFALAFNSTQGVLWITYDPLSIPPYKGMVPIVIAWFFAPIATAFVSASMFSITRAVVLRNENSYERSFYTLPLFVTFCSWINIYFVFVKGAKKTIGTEDNWSDNKAAWVAVICAACIGLFTFACTPLIRKRAEYLESVHQKKLLDKQAQLDENGTDEAFGADSDKVGPPVDPPVELLEEKKFLGFACSDFSCGKIGLGIKNFFNNNGLDLGYFKEENGKMVEKEWIKDLPPDIQTMQDRAEVFDSKTERVFGVLQVFSAICVMFAHGAGEVGYMAGPLATIWVVNQTGKLPKSVEAPIWIIVISALSLVAGIATYGKTMTKRVGTEFCKITPARGFAAELSTAVVIMVASQYGLPTSSSQCITGGIIGVGMCEGMSGVNWKYFFQTFSSWVMTMFVMGIGVGILFAQGHNAP